MNEAEFWKIFDERLKHKILKKLNNRLVFDNDFNLHGIDQEYNQIYQMLENTMKFREGKSAIIVGPRGVGKTRIINKALKELELKGQEFFVIRISGIYQKDDKLAIKEIARQLDWYLKKHHGIEENFATFEKKSLIGTMNSIMNILDKTALNEDDIGKSDKDKGYYIPIIFVIDEIDRYTHNSRQTLLYNLFDIAQSSSSKTNAGNGKHSTVSVIGISTKATIREQFEKRVKSRFSQRIIQVNKSKNLEDFCESVYCMIKLGDLEEDAEIVQCFNGKIRKLLFEKSELRKLVIENYFSIKDLNGVRNVLIPFIMNSLKDTKFQKDGFETFNNRNLEMIKSLSELELKLLVCCCRVKFKNSYNQVNFDLAFEEYLRMIRIEQREMKAKLQVLGVNLNEKNNYTISRDLLQVCWERLVNVGLLGLVGEDNSNGGGDGNVTSGRRNTQGVNSELGRQYMVGAEMSEVVAVSVGSTGFGTWLDTWRRL